VLSSSASAQYSTDAVGDPPGNGYFSDWCTAYHTGADTYVDGLAGLGNWNPPYEFWYVGAQCYLGGSETYRGTHTSVTPDYQYCGEGEFISGLDGYFSKNPSRVTALSGSCYSPSANAEHYLDGWFGQKWTSNYRAVWCQWGDAATGIWGSTNGLQPNTALMRVGLICTST
jgi:hypothetical protein